MNGKVLRHLRSRGIGACVETKAFSLLLNCVDDAVVFDCDEVAKNDFGEPERNGDVDCGSDHSTDDSDELAVRFERENSRSSVDSFDFRLRDCFWPMAGGSMSKENK